jgi:hypothetical protein
VTYAEGLARLVAQFPDEPKVAAAVRELGLFVSQWMEKESPETHEVISSAGVGQLDLYVELTRGGAWLAELVNADGKVVRSARVRA